MSQAIQYFLNTLGVILAIGVPFVLLEALKTTTQVLKIFNNRREEKLEELRRRPPFDDFYVDDTSRTNGLMQVRIVKDGDTIWKGSVRQNGKVQ